MEKETFAKLFDFPGQQVLVTKDFSDDENAIIRITTQIDQVEQSVSMSFKSYGSMDKAFNEYNKQNAEKFLNTMLQMWGVDDSDPASSD